MLYTVYAGRKSNKWDWEHGDFCPTPAQIRDGREILEKGGISIEISSDGRGGSAKVGRFMVEAKGLPISYEHVEERFPWSFRPVSCTCAAYAKNRKCKHVAAFILAWERDVSPFTFTEPDDLYQERLDKEAKERAESELAPHFADLNEVEGRMFHPWYALNNVKASEEEIKGAKNLVERGLVGQPTFTLTPDYLHEQRLTVTLPFKDGAKATAYVTPAKGYVEMDFSCTCATARAFRRYSDDLCRHEIVALRRLWEYVETHDPGDTTNADGLQLMRSMQRAYAASVASDTGAVAQKEHFRLVPQISVGAWGGNLTFRLELESGRAFALRNLPNFLAALDKKGALSISQKSSVDFSRLAIDPESERWLRFIRLNMRTIERVNAMIDNSHSGFYASKHPANFGYKSYVPVEYETMDAFYELAQGTDLVAGDGTSHIYVGPVDAVVHIDVKIERDEAGNATEAHVTGDVPLIWEGYTYYYLVLSHAIIRISEQEQALFSGIFDTRRGGRLDATIGRKYLDIFLNETLPLLMRNRILEVTCS